MLKEVQEHVSEPLPDELYLGLDAFDQQGKEQRMDQLMSYLYQNGTFPRIVDIGIAGIKEDRVLIWIRPSGHTYVTDFSQTWDTPADMGPFKVIGLILPPHIWDRPRPLSSQELVEAGNKWGKFIS